MWKNFHSPFNLMIQIRFNSKLLSICLFVCVLCFLHFMSLCLVWIYVQSLCSILFFCCGDSQYKIVVSGLNQTIMCLMMIEKKRNLKEYQRWWWWWSSTTTIKFFFYLFFFFGNYVHIISGFLICNRILFVGIVHIGNCRTRFLDTRKMKKIFFLRKETGSHMDDVFYDATQTTTIIIIV